MAIRWIDILKGIGIIMVVIGHSCPPDGLLAKIIFSFHMPLFFFVSGYLFNYWKYKSNFDEFIMNNIRRLIIPSIITLLIVWLYSYIFLQNLFPNHLIDSFWMLMINFCIFVGYPIDGQSFASPVGPMWFLACLFFSRLIFYKALSIKNTTSLFLFVLVLTYIGVKMGGAHVFPWSIDIAFVSTYFMLAGWLSRKYNLFSVIKPWMLVGVSVLWIYDITQGGISMNNREYLFPLISLNGAIAGTVFWGTICVYLDKLEERNNFFINKFINLLSYCGKNSLIILIFHTMDTGFFHFDLLFNFYKYIIENNCYFSLVIVRLIECFIYIYMIRHPFKKILSKWY